jgi:site-specific recombinase XerD
MIEKRNMKNLNVNGLRDRAILELIASSGMSPENVINLTFDELLDVIVYYIDVRDFINSDKNLYCIDHVAEWISDRDDLIGVWILPRYKTDYKYIIFSNNESIHLIIKYLQEKKSDRERIISSDEPLFTDLEENKLSIENITTIFKEISVKTGQDITPHQLRKLFIDILHEQGADEYFLDLVLGHIKIPNFSPEFDIISFRDVYMKNFDEHLSFEKVLEYARNRASKRSIDKGGD